MCYFKRVLSSLSGFIFIKVDIHRQNITNVSKELEALEHTNIGLISNLLNQNYCEAWFLILL